MLRHYSTRWATAAILFSVGLLIAARPARASDVQITLNNLTFSSSFGSEVFNGSFLVDTATDEAISSSIDANGVVGLNFFGVDLTGSEPFQFAFDDGFGDVLFLNLASGLSNMSYGSADASIFPAGGLGSFGFTFENGSSGSFAAGASATTPEPGSLVLLLTGSLLILGGEFARRVAHRSRHVFLL
ncbi:MAG TPA: hypothetical protein VGR94_07115 [Candidatus Acidoferrales bacterium]|nr:hypothetical protein [Candidatus Acidoferrales bacterium]